MQYHVEIQPIIRNEVVYGWNSCEADFHQLILQRKEWKEKRIKSVYLVLLPLPYNNMRNNNN